MNLPPPSLPPLLDDELGDLLAAIIHNDIEVVRNCVEHIDMVSTSVFSTAVEYNGVEIVEILAPKCSAETIRRGFNRAFMAPVVNMQIIYALIPHSNQMVRNQTMFEACVGGHMAVVDALYPVCEIPKVLTVLHKYGADYLGFWHDMLCERMKAEKLRETLNNEVSSTTQAPQRKM